MADFFISDTHFRHKNVIQYCDRPFQDVHQMNDAMVGNWNAIVGSSDTVWILGDFVFGGLGPITEFNQKLTGKKILVRGNHDDKRVLKPENWERLGFERVIDSTPQGYLHELAPNLFVKLSHFPYKGGGDSSHEERYEERRCIDDGKTWLLHGHCHGYIGRVRERSIDVGVDASKVFAPIAADEYVRLINQEG